MKKILLFAFGLALTSGTYAQLTCNPDAVSGSFGIAPQDLLDAVVGVPYSQQLDFKAPTTTADIPGAPVNAPLKSFKILSVTGLPDGFTHACNKPNCEGYVGGDAGCAELVGTATTGQEGVYNIAIKIQATVTIFGNDVSQEQTFPFLFTVQPDPNADGCGITLSSGKTPLCVDSTLQLTSLTEGGVWSFAGGATTSNFATLSPTGEVKGVKKGNIIITYGGGTSGCTTPGQYFIAVDSCKTSTGGGTPPPEKPGDGDKNGVNDLTHIKSVLYPNPARTLVAINNATDYLSYEIYDINGRILIAESIENAQALIDIKSFNDGVYFVRLNHLNGASETHKIIKQ